MELVVLTIRGTYDIKQVVKEYHKPIRRFKLTVALS
jgi:hypothetical protein